VFFVTLILLILEIPRVKKPKPSKHPCAWSSASRDENENPLARIS